ncbi:hypothetical protein OESDEN_02735 [Oesophagostomum dentatum]|uniref:Uncharacterized protein n=1 Tax=Oesophagostomum dentatum TaxID=61180 RepID=A0A0B1TPG6_OESDE|nr:hypothetical protein OESDEN_02735 [Oesophagostomum dentatum]
MSCGARNDGTSKLLLTLLPLPYQSRRTLTTLLANEARVYEVVMVEEQRSDNSTTAMFEREKISVLKGLVLLLLIAASLVAAAVVVAILLWLASRSLFSSEPKSMDAGNANENPQEECSSGKLPSTPEILPDPTIPSGLNPREECSSGRLPSTPEILPDPTIPSGLKHALDDDESRSIKEVSFDLDPKHMEEDGTSVDYLQINAVYNTSADNRSKSLSCTDKKIDETSQLKNENDSGQRKCNAEVKSKRSGSAKEMSTKNELTGPKKRLEKNLSSKQTNEEKSKRAVKQPSTTSLNSSKLVNSSRPNLEETGSSAVTNSQLTKTETLSRIMHEILDNIDIIE